jgi:hypothetical protein
MLYIIQINIYALKLPGEEKKKKKGVEAYLEE